MISGAVTESLDAIIPLVVQRSSTHSESVEAVVDTGFTGFLTLPLVVIESLQLPWMYRQQGLLADGRLHTFDVYSAVINWDDRERTIEVEAADIEPLVGMSLLSQHRLTVDVRPGGTVSVELLDWMPSRALRGKIQARDGKFTGQLGHGNFVERKPTHF